jgi:nucleotide-binding universal stress UspA family protein
MGDRADQAADHAESVAQTLVSRFQGDGIEASAEVVDGQAGEVLVRAAAAQNADLIVVGRRGHGLAASLLLGSTSEYVVRRATTPVLVAN